MKTIIYFIFSFLLIGKIQAQSLDALNAQAQKLYETGKYTEAVVVFEQSRTQAAKEYGKEHVNYASYCNNLGVLYTNLGLYTKATPLLLEAKGIREKKLGKQHVDYASSCDNLANLYESQGLYSNAEPLYVEAKDIRAKILGKEHQDYATSCSNLAVLYKIQGFYGKAELLCTEAKDIRAKILGKEHPDYASSCSNLANLQQNQGLYPKATTLHLEAKSIREKVLGKKHPDYANSCGSLANLYEIQGLYAKAMPLFIETKEIREKVLGKKHPDYATSCNNLANLYQKQGFYDKAMPLFVEAKSIREKVLGKEHPDYATSCNNLAVLYTNLGLYLQAASFYMETQEIRERKLGKDHPDYANSCNNLAFLHNQLNELTEANTYYQLASQALLAQTENNVAHLSEKEKEQFLTTFYYHFETYNSFTIKAAKKIPELTAWSFNNSLATKGLLFSSTQKMRERIQYSKDKNLQELYENWKNIRIKYAKSLQMGAEERKKQNISSEKLKIEANEIEKTLSLKSEFFAKVNDKRRYTWKDVQKHLKAGEVIVEIIRTRYYGKKQTDSTLYMALIITPTTQNQPEMVVLSNGKELETDVVAYYKNTIQFKVKDNVSYNAFWAQIKAKLGNAKKVYFVPDGVYHQINLVTLQNPATKAYLRNETQVQLLSSSKDLIKYAENAKKQRKNFKDYQIHLFGYPNYAQKGEKKPTTKEERSLSFSAKMDTTQRFFDANSGVITVLEGTKKEINNISKILTDKKITNTVYLENKADEGTVKALKNPDILHIATHGFFLGDTEKFDKDNADKFRENPLLRSGLLLKDAEKGLRGEILEGEDGVLTAQEAINLNLDDTELVVMSACETGLGEIKNGEGVYGLQRSFQQAGAKTILMSLWKVDDIATQELMTAFYTNLASGKTKRQSFDDAQETLYKKYKNPYFWGAFVMVGE